MRTTHPKVDGTVGFNVTPNNVLVNGTVGFNIVCHLTPKSTAPLGWKSL